jgi:hypothetical protein
MFFGMGGLLLLGLLFTVGGMEGYQYSESSQFCGTLCHPMVSVLDRYQHSAHAQVACGECHVGPGFSYFVRSKFEGTRQLMAVLSNSYSRPIKSPVQNLRPARETCEACHNPRTFKDNIIKSVTHYDNDEKNTIVQSNFLLKMGGWEETSGVSQGIHWHVTNPVYYLPADAKRQVIPWVGVEKDGKLVEYFARDMLDGPRSSLVDEARANGTLRKMDCIDCHNRTAHLIPTPETAVDELISAGKVSTDLPYVRARAVDLLTPAYKSRDEALAAVDGLVDYYKTSYPDVFQYKRPQIEAAVSELKNLYAEVAFPDMGLNWQTNPNNSRHGAFPGCFRCHDGNHVTVDEQGNAGKAISGQCNLCHTVPMIGRGNARVVEAPIVVGAAPATHNDFRWTIEHRNVTDADKRECLNCHGQAFCDNGLCHSVKHGPDMLFTHADESRAKGQQICDTCHQEVLCNQCHPGQELHSIRK